MNCFLQSLRGIAIARWSCMLEQADEHRSIWGRRHLCLSRVGPPYPKFGPSISLRPFYTPLAGCGAHCARAFVHCAKDTLGFWPTYWMLSRWQRDDALTCSLGSEYFCGYLGRGRLCIVCQEAYTHLDTLPKGPSHGLASGGVGGGHPKCTDLQGG